MSKQLNRTNVGERISDTKKEIAQLSEELEKLIKSNANLGKYNLGEDESGDANAIKSTPMDLETIQKTQTKAGPVQTHIGNSDKTAYPANKNKTKTGLMSSKNVTHDKEATREYMRQQRERREEMKKKTDSKTKIDLELRKQKLQELQQKSLALVQRNLQLKRERSKSRDRRQQLRIDKSLPNTTELRTAPTKISTNNSTPRSRINWEKESAVKLLKVKDYEKNPNKSASNISTKPVIVNSKSKFENVKENLVNIPKFENSSKTNADLAASKIQQFFRNYRTRKQLEAKKKTLENPVTKTKETQTSSQKQIEFPEWLQPTSINQYPYNFINTVKKKLQFVVNTPVKSKDIGIQSSIMESKNVTHRSSEKVPISNAHLKLRNNSQKETNLDAEALRHFNLINFTDKFSRKEKEKVGSDSESDTSKNIPEISTESGLVPEDKVIEGGKHDSILSIDTDKLKNLTLRRPSKESLSKQSHTLKITEHDSKSDVEISRPKSSPRSPRDSIVSFNISSELSQNESSSSESIAKEKITKEKFDKFNLSEKQSSKKKLFLSPKSSSDTYKSDFENSKISTRNSEEINVRISSDEINRSGLKNNERELKSSRSSKDSNEVYHKSTKKVKSIEKFENRLRFVNTDRLTVKNSETSDKNMTSSMQSLISTISLKSSTVPTEMEKKDERSPAKIQEEKISTSFLSSRSKSTDKVSTDLSQANSSEKPSKTSKHNKNSKEKMPSVEAEDHLNSDKAILSMKPENSVVNNGNSQVVKDLKGRVVQTKSDTNEIHLKFEAEVHLLNDFNESLKQFMAVERAFESIKSKNENSFRNGSKNSSGLIFPGDNEFLPNLSKHIGYTINTSRGSEIDETSLDRSSVVHLDMQSTNNLELSNMHRNVGDSDSFSFDENISNLAGLSIKMFEQFIKDEDIRIENLKTIIKIREQALLDRTKGELAWLEIQRKHLKETGKFHEASLVKKKQRGILLKHQQERREMQRLKQLQKIQSKERKTILKEQKNLIKAKLTSEKLMSEMKIQTSRKRRTSGPMRVLKASESHSETSVSRRASEAEEIFSITSRSRSVQLSEVDTSREFVFKHEETDVRKIEATENIDKMKKALLVRQASLTKRRQVLEDLLKRHQKLLEEEKKIKELEMAAKAMIMQVTSMPATSREPKIKSQLKEVKQKVIPPVDNEASQMKTPKEIISDQSVQISKKGNENFINSSNSQSENTFDAFYKDAISTINEIRSNSEKKSSVDYSEDFESEKTHIDTAETNNLSSISELIKDFTQIEHGISMFSKNFEEITTNKTNETKDTQNIVIDPEIAPIESSDNSKSTGTILSEESLIETKKNEDIETSDTIASTIPSVILSGDMLNSEEVSSEESGSESIALKTESFFPYGIKNLNTTSVENVESRSSSNEIQDDQVISFKKIQLGGASNQNNDHIPSIESSPGEIKSISDDLRTETEENQTDTDTASKKHELLAISNSTESKSENLPTETIFLITNETLTSKNDEDIEKQNEISTEKEINSMLQEKPLNENNFDENTKNDSLKDETYKDIPSIKTNSEINSDDTTSKNVSDIDDILELNETNTNVDNREQPSDQKEIKSVETSISYKNSQDTQIISEKIQNELDIDNVVNYDETDIIKAKDYHEFDDEIFEEGAKIPENVNEESSYKNSSDSEIISEKIQNELDIDDVVNDNKIEIIEAKDNHEIDDEIFKEGAKIPEDVNDESSNKNSSDSEIISEKIQNELDKEDVVNDNKIEEIKTEDYNQFEDENFKQRRTEIESKGAKIPEEVNEESSSEENKLLDEEIDNKIEMIKAEDNHKFDEENFKQRHTEIECIEGAKIPEEVNEESSSEENKLSDEENDAMRKYSKDDSSANSYSDDFEDEKEEISSNKTDNSEKDILKRINEDHKISQDVVMVKIDLKRDSNEAEIVIMNEDSNEIPKKNCEDCNDGKVKSPIQQRVSQIMANTVGSQKSPRDKSTRYQDYYVTTYEDITPVHSPETASPVKSNQLTSIDTFTNEAEELLKKQLAIELEIKHLEQQQKEQQPFVYIREIPNKPPPPYTPPSTQNTVTTILPSREDDLKEICRYSAKVLYNAYLSNNLHGVTFSETDFKTINSTKSSKECCLFVFDLCREITENHYKRFQNRKERAWLKIPEAHLILGKPYTYHQLENHIHIRVRELLGISKPNIRENSVIRWSKKKKDHCDEILVLEAQAEEQEWLNYDRDELMVKNEVTDAIFDIILSETVEIFKNIFS